MDMDEGLKKLEDLRKMASLGGGKARVDKLHAEGSLTAEERLDLLLDRGTFLEFNALAGPQPAEFGPPPPYLPRDGVITGFGKINGRTIGVYAHDRTVQGGSLGNVQAAKIAALIRRACEIKVPVVALQDSVGARIQEGNKNVGFDSIFFACTQASGVIPLIAVIMGRCAGGVAFTSALMDFIFMIQGKSALLVTGPEVLRAVTHEEVSLETLGGAKIHSEKSGACDRMVQDETEVIRLVQEMLQFLPGSSQESPPRCPSEEPQPASREEIRNLVPSNPKKSYDMRRVLQVILDKGYFCELKPRFAKNILTGFGRVDGETIGVIANQPMVLAGALDVDASDKASRFIRFCDAFNIPLLTLVDVPGYLPGVDQEHKGVIRHGAKMLFAYAEATVPKITIILRKDYGGGKQAMCSKPMGADLVLAWPSAELAVMGAEGAVPVICRREIKESRDPEETRRRLTEKYRQIFDGPFESARKMYIDDVIKPEETRPKIIQALAILKNKKVSRVEKKHGNMPV